MRQTDWMIRYLLLGLWGPLIYLNLWLLGQVFNFFEQVITITTLAAILSLLLNYPVQWLGRAGVRRNIAILLVAVLAFSLLVLIGVAIIPSVINQATELLQAIPQWLADSNKPMSAFNQFAQNRRLPIDVEQVKLQLERGIQLMLELLPEFAISTLGRLFDTILMIVLTFYMLLYGRRMWLELINLLPKPYGNAISQSLKFNFQQFFISQLLLALFMFVLLTVIFLLLRVKFGLLFALIIGLFELIPFIGATIGISLVIVLVLLQGPWLSVQVAVFTITLQQIKDNIIAPKLFGKFIGLNPIWVFVALLIGGRVAGLLGILMSIPIAGTLSNTFERIQRVSLETELTQP